jgi:hypothetical protein
MWTTTCNSPGRSFFLFQICDAAATDEHRNMEFILIIDMCAYDMKIVSVDGGDLFPQKDIKKENLRQNIQKLLVLKKPQNLAKNLYLKIF